MTMTHRENIPFFNELPPKAIKAASRLWDVSHDPAYNGVQAYHDFVQDLTFAGIAAPPRSVVKRWLAGVQAGIVERPDGPLAALERAEAMQTVGADAEPVPAKAKPQRKPRQPPVDPAPRQPAPAVDADVTTVDVLVVDPETGTVEQPKIVVELDPDTRHINLVSIGESGQEQFEKLTPATFGRTAFTPLLEAGITPPEPGDERPDPALALIARQMIEEEVARINMNVRAQATANVAARLRQMAASLDGDTPKSNDGSGGMVGQMVYVSSRAS